MYFCNRRRVTIIMNEFIFWDEYWNIPVTKGTNEYKNSNNTQTILQTGSGDNEINPPTELLEK